MLTDYLIEPPGCADAGTGGVLPNGPKPVSRVTSAPIRLPCIRPSVGKDVLLALLRMQSDLLTRLEHTSLPGLNGVQEVCRLISDATDALPGPVVRLARNICYAHMYARSKFPHNAPWAGPHHLALINRDSWPQQATTPSRKLGLIDVDGLPGLDHIAASRERAFRYLLFSAVTVHSGMVWASDLLTSHAFQEIQAALLVCAAPCRPDWKDCARSEAIRDYERATYDEATLARARAVSNEQLRTYYGRPAVTFKMSQLARQAWNLAVQAGLSPHKSGYGPLIARLPGPFRETDIRGFTLSLYLLTFLLPLLREVAVNRMRPPSVHERKPAPEPGRYELARGKSPLERQGIQSRVFSLRPGHPALFPAEMEAMSFARLGQRHLPFVVARNNDTGFAELYVPGLECTAARLRRMYGMPEPEMLFALPADLERLTDLEAAEFGRRMEDRLGAIYLGLRDARPLFAGEAEPRPPRECPPEDLFHCFLLEGKEKV